MRISSIFSLLVLFIFGSCNKIIQEEQMTVQEEQIVARKDYSIIQLIEDDKKIAEYHFSKSGKLITINEYLSNGDLENEIHFKYKANNIDFVFLNSEKSKDEWLTNYYLNIENYNDIIINRGIKCDNPFLICNEVSDLQNLLSNIESFKRIDQKNQSVFRAKELKLNILFYPSTMERFIPQNSVINYFEYALDKRGVLISEIIKFNDGILTIKYFYRENKISEVMYSLKYNNGELLELSKKYHLIN